MENNEWKNGESLDLCEKCSKVLSKLGFTKEEMKEQQAEFDFGMAISFLKEGEKVARKGWNGKDMFIYLVNGSAVPVWKLRNEAKEHVTRTIQDTTPVQINSHIDMKAADGSIVIGWLASQTDMLAEDWYLV